MLNANVEYLFCPSAMGFRQPYSNFSNRWYPLAQNRGTIPMGIAVWRAAEKAKIAIFAEHPAYRVERGTPRTAYRVGRGTPRTAYRVERGHPRTAYRVQG